MSEITTTVGGRETVVSRDLDDGVVHVRIGYLGGENRPLEFTDTEWLAFVKEINDLMVFAGRRSESND